MIIGNTPSVDPGQYPHIAPNGAPGYRADVNVIDYEGLTLHSPQVAYDLPAGARRLKQKSDGLLATVVNGKVVLRNNEHTGALPGKLLRGPLAQA